MNALLAVAMLMCAVQERGAQPPANALVVILDDVGETERALLPSLNSIAASGVTFDRFYTWPVCSPTRFAVLTGIYPRSSGIGDVVNAFNSATGSPAPDRRLVMLPEALRLTHETCLVGKWHLGRASEGDRADLLDTTEGGPFVSGFDSWLAGSPNSIAQPGATKDGYFNWYRVDDGTVSRFHSTYATAAQRDAFVSWWTGTSGPKFAVLAFNAAHQPYDTPPGYVPAATTRGAYENVIAYLDGALGGVLGVVSLADTFVFVLGDNGTPDEARPEGTPSGFWKGTTFEGGVNVPLIVAGPGITPKSNSQRLVSALDLGPTLFEMLGITSRGFEDGRSFADALGTWTGAKPRSFVFTERYDTPGGGVQPTGYDDQAVIEATWKLRRVDPDGTGGALPVVDSAYNLVTDPFEQAPIDPALLPVALRTRLLDEMNAQPARLP